MALCPHPFNPDKKGGERYITKNDTSTVSWIDFGCSKLMLLYAVIAAIIAITIALIVGTGGAALIAIGAAAGAAGAVMGAIDGSQICGQKVAGVRKWVGSKSNFQVLDIDTITSDHTMVCSAFTFLGMSTETIQYAPNIKSWSQAISKGVAGYIGKVFEGMMAGAAIGAIFAGGAGLANGGWGAARSFITSMPKNFLLNAWESVKWFGLGMRGVMGVQNVANTYGDTGSASIKDFGSGLIAMETGAIESVKVMYGDITGNPMLDANGNPKHTTWQDVAGTALMFLPVAKGKKDLENSLRNEPDSPKFDENNNKIDDAESNNKTDDAESNKGDEDGNNTKGDATDAENSKKDGDGEAYEAPPKTVNKELIDAVEAKAKNKEKGYSNKKNGPCLSGVYDPVTGEIYFGKNFEKNSIGKSEYNKFVEDAHPIIQDRIKQQQRLIDEGKLAPELDKRAGGHSEVRALDEAIKAREKATGKAVTEADFDLHNRQMPNNNPMHRCGNCSHITNGVNTIGHK